MMHIPLARIMEVERYLDRLCVKSAGGPSLGELRALHLGHLLNIPFENLDIHRGVEIVLDEERILEKIIRDRRGGFCYELNSSFAWLLRIRGFQVTMLSGEVARKEGGFGIPFDHMTLRVDLDLPWLADVGFGDCFRLPIPLETETEVEQLGVRFRLVREETWWILERLSREDQDYRPQYRFTLEPRELSDYVTGCRYHQTSSKSTFTRGTICTKALPDGRVTLHPDSLVMTREGCRTEEAIQNHEEWMRALEERFGIVIPQSATGTTGLNTELK